MAREKKPLLNWPKLNWPKQALRIYWDAYGGVSALRTSAYLWFSVALALFCLFFKAPDFSWSDAALSIVPDLLGFSLGGYAIMVGFGDTEFLEALRGKEEEGKPSPYMKLNATFLHFIIVQAITLVFALIAKALDIASWDVVAFLGLLLLIYTTMTIVAAAFTVLAIANLYDQKPK
ncbi:MAG: hypothetical protein WCZ10_15150 [Desulfobulbaceae bacterium]